MSEVKRRNTEYFEWTKVKEEFLINYHRDNVATLYGTDDFSPTEKNERDARAKLVEEFNGEYDVELPGGIDDEVQDERSLTTQSHPVPLDVQFPDKPPKQNLSDVAIDNLDPLA
ncbi:hypothetical protein QAD02_001959 [Eretmocerus hayati]|uniref:Uncharacterized protein n=1 Tax=Eretmocerus hayati TaxID=131215 RepID=A0ACC2NHR5_9HYME|nr:hypothetical protein QAD02_001959 [Eretmocerus hayati]